MAKVARRAKRVGWWRMGLGCLAVALGVAVAGAWVWSRWRMAYSVSGAWGFELGNGQLKCVWYPGANITPESGVVVLMETERFWRLRTQGSVEPSSNANRAWSVWVASHFSSVTAGVVMSQHWRVVLWPVPLALWGVGALVVRSGNEARKRAITGRCRACGYSLAGLREGAACPECGKGKKST